MEKDLAKRFVTKDGSKRISIYRDDCHCNPRDTTDEPFHCEDWHRNYSIMNKHENETKSNDALNLIKYMLERYGNSKEMINVLKANHKSDKHEDGDNCLMYDHVSHTWILFYWQAQWKDYSGGYHGNQWVEECRWGCKINKLTAFDFVSYLSDEMIEVFSDKKYFTDGVKIGSYSFGYYGEVSFSDSFDTDSDGICWLEKDEFMKYSGCNEEYWKKDFKDIEWLMGEIEAWSNNEVYGFVVENAVRIQGVKTYYNGEKEDEPYVEEQWEEDESCWGFYGELSNVLEYMISDAGFNMDELEEVKE